MDENISLEGHQILIDEIVSGVCCHSGCGHSSLFVSIYVALFPPPPPCESLGGLSGPHLLSEAADLFIVNTISALSQSSLKWQHNLMQNGQMLVNLLLLFYHGRLWKLPNYLTSLLSFEQLQYTVQ